MSAHQAVLLKLEVNIST